MNPIEALIDISKYAGERFDLVQAGGGNSSVKLEDGTMLIKASGFSLGDVAKDIGYSKVYTQKIKDIVSAVDILQSNDKREREQIAARLVKEATIDINNRPSIETLLHSLVYKYTLHTHPVVANMILNKPNWQETSISLFGNAIAMVEYKTPGIELALALNQEILRLKAIPKIIFLQNHGLIITSDDFTEIKYLTDMVIVTIEKYLQVDMKKYKGTTEITKLVKQFDKTDDNISYLCNDLDLNQYCKNQKELFLQKPFCPDSLVYCGLSGIELKSIDDTETIKIYFEKYYEIPKVIIFQNNIFLRAKTVKKAKEMEDVLKFHILVLAQNLQKTNYLEFEELAYLSNWEAEKYRQKI